MPHIYYCRNCGSKNERQNPKGKHKCNKCGRFLDEPIIVNPLQTKTSDEIYKTISVKSSENKDK